MSDSGSMGVSATPLLDKRSREVQERLVLEHGTREATEAWLDTPNGYPALHGQTPDQWFDQLGETIYINWSADVKVTATGAFPRV